jgi:hypothetical protein
MVNARLKITTFSNIDGKLFSRRLVEENTPNLPQISGDVNIHLFTIPFIF